MEEIVLSPLLQVIYDRVASPVLQRLADMWDLKDNLKRLQQSLLMVQAILEDAEEQQVTRKAVRVWLSMVKSAASDAEDLLNEFTARGSLDVDHGVPEVHGREKDKEKIVQLLLSRVANLEGYPAVIPIIGIGGIGKTTLAQLAYNDEIATQHFDVKTWVFVSENFDVKRIMKAIIESATKERCKFTETDVIRSKLLDLLHKKRCLIVLDDVWTEDLDDWEKLRPLFRGGDVGSKIIITTRSIKVGMILDSPTFPYYLEVLDEEDSWTLFRQRAFRVGEEENYPNLLPIGKQIVKKCGGLPLATKTLGSLMRFKRDERGWLLVASSELWSSNVDHGGILPSLMLSYRHIPSHLKRCFAFCSIFPKNYEIKKEKLIHLWIAEGFILQEGDEPAEDIGNQYFNDLVWICFFQKAEKCDNRYKMHDTIHDLARYVAGKEFLILEKCPASNNLAQVRHSSIISKFGSFSVPEALYKAGHLRTLMLIVGGDLQEVPKKLFLHFRYLLVLDLNSSGLKKLEESIGGLFCLKYLDLSYTFIRILPQTIRYLYSLQSLNLHGCCYLEQLPSLPEANLRHLIITECQALELMPDILPQGLRTLPIYILRFGRLLGLKDLDLHGELKIKRLQKVKTRDDAESANMRLKENLKSLGLYWCENDGQLDNRIDAVEDILEALQPHQNLEELHMEGYPGIKFPNWSLPNLIMVNLSNCKKCECLPTLGNLSFLKMVSFCGMDGVKGIGLEFYGEGMHTPFPELEELTIKGFPNLEEWSIVNDGQTFPKLRKLIVNNCPRLAKMPSFRSLQHLELRDCSQTIFSNENLPSLSILAIEKIPELCSLPRSFLVENTLLTSLEIISCENLPSLSILAIEKIPELFSLPRSFLVENTLLTSLEIISCPKLHSLPSELGSLISLKTLTIRWCEELTSLPQSLQNLKALEYLEICECHNIISLPDNGLGGLTSLRILSIENCSKLISLSSSLEHLTSLEQLTIMYCPSLSSLPEGLQHLSALRSLTMLSCPLFSTLPEELQYVTTLLSLEIHSCPGLTALPEWFRNLTSLRSLTISDCHNLKCLPESFSFSALQYLCIQDCPRLEERSN
ncbi:LOW QUALITY PROTEIN: disease resistance protein RGA2-like [Jatropha curcas]|uniref:LOW QUALITY PROTEIN: disease resistance protein RGA2-like n=1 Tax=Jatropha curcas TaxID=180498 RepID=UPI0018943C88|nr:LOW QUALITY PROTEIN: disease resistance protein RGA2-like [Jatropha curcas]